VPVLSRSLHPGAWWIWALGLAAAASRTTSPALLALIGAVTGYVVAARRSDAPWARAYTVFLRIGLVVLAVRVVLQILFGAPVPGTVLVTLPELGLPAWMAGVRVGGEVTAEGMLAAVYDGLRLAVLLACIGAANALASPSRLLRCLPGALYEAGVAVVVALSFAPQAVAGVARVRAARRLRGRPDRGVAGLRGLALPVLEDALERSLQLAASMDSRGYGRRAAVPTAVRRTTGLLVLAGLLGTCLGTYGLLDGGSPPLLGLPAVALGALLATVGLVLGGRRTVRSRYRPDPWQAPEWLVAGSGVLAAAGVVAAGLAGADLRPAVTEPALPDLPLAGAAAVVVAVLPAWAAPPPPRTSGPQPPRAGRRSSLAPERSPAAGSRG